MRPELSVELVGELRRLGPSLESAFLQVHPGGPRRADRTHRCRRLASRRLAGGGDPRSDREVLDRRGGRGEDEGDYAEFVAAYWTPPAQRSRFARSSQISRRPRNVLLGTLTVNLATGGVLRVNTARDPRVCGQRWRSD